MATTSQLEHCALVAVVRHGPDQVAATAVTAFAGDINAHTHSPTEETVLHAAVWSSRPQTVAALAARGDCNPNTVRLGGIPVLCYVAGPWYDKTDMATFLVHFPTLNVDACDAAGDTPLHYAAYDDGAISIQLLLDAGADPSIRSRVGRSTPAQLAWRLHGRYGRTRCTRLLKAAEAWHSGLRRGWLRAVVGMSGNIAV